MKKGFTLIELLAVIVILAIIMVIAVPQILNVINNSRTSAWKDNVKMIERAIETNEALLVTSIGDSNGSKSVFDGGCNEQNITIIADLSDDTSIKNADGDATVCSFELAGANNFANKTGKVKCTPSAGCSSCSDSTSETCPQ